MSDDKSFPLGFSGYTATVHKSGDEGALTIDGRTGNILTTPAERPEWASGLACALLAERMGFYTVRLGPHYVGSEAFSRDVIAAEDLGWIAVDPETGNEIEIEADTEHRMNTVAAAIGMDRDEGTMVAPFAELALDPKPSSLLTSGQETVLEPAGEQTELKAATGH